MKRLVSIIMLLVMIQGCCYAEGIEQLESFINSLFELILPSSQQEEIANMTHTEVVAELRSMGIEISDEVIEEVEAWMVSNQQTMIEWGFDHVEQSYEFAANLLMHIGMGEYDYDTGTWTPTSSTVYAFDAEIFDVEHMYRLFLQGVASIVPGFEPTDIQESIEENAAENFDYGKTTVSFVLNGNRYEHELHFMGDWFDEDAVVWINEVLSQENFEHRLYKFYDWSQGLILIYGDDTVWEKLGKLIPQPDWLY